MTRCRRTDERGVTLIEVVLTMTLVVALTGAALGALDGFTRAEHRQSASAEARQALRQALDELSRDLRSAVTVTPGSPNGTDSLVVARLDDEGSAQVEVDASGSTVTRTVDGEERVVLEHHVIGGDPTFSYFTASGAEMDPTSVGAAAIEACTARVDVRLATQPGGAPEPVVASRSVALRNFHEVTPC